MKGALYTVLIRLALAAAVPSAFGGGIPIKVCRLSSDLGKILPRANDLSSDFGGFRMAIKEYNASHSRTVDWTLPPHNPQLPDLLSRLEWAEREGCHILVGLVSSRDALLAAKTLTKNRSQLIGFSSTATADELDQTFPAVMSASTSMSSWVREIVGHLRKSAYRSIFIISKPDDVYSLLFTQRLSSELKNIPIKRMQLSSEDLLPETDLTQFVPSSKTAILYTTYPIVSLPSLAQIAQITKEGAKDNWNIFGTQSWVETQTFLARKDVIESLPPIFLLNAWDTSKNIGAFRDFAKKYQENFNQSPDHDSAYDYDVMQMILNCADNAPKEKKIREHFKNCLSKKHTYLGITGRYDFDGKRSHPIRKELLVPFNLRGMIPMVSHAP